MEDRMKTLRVSFIVSTERLGPVLQAISGDIEHLKVEDVANIDPPPPPAARVRQRRSRVEVARAGKEENRLKGEHIARTECGQFVLKKMSELLRCTSSEMALIFSTDLRWKPATASPVMSSLRAAGYLTKESDRPGAPYVFVKMPSPVRRVA
jgi:hypothetical protein